MIRVFLADDHAIVRSGLRQALRDLGNCEIVGEAENGRQVLDAPDIDRWDVLVLDLSLPKLSGPEVLRRIKARRPDLPVVVLSMYPEEQYARRMLAAGASAYLAKGRPPADIVAAVRTAARGGPRPAPVSASGPRPPHEALSKREHQIFMRVVEGQSVAEVAAELDIHSCTVSNHLANIRRKLGAATVAALVRYACDHGLLALAPRCGDE